MTPETAAPRTEFDWAIYADATFAGLSFLIPIPLLDLAFERWFRRRMPRTIARRRDCHLKPQVIRELNRSRSDILRSCLMWPFFLAFEFVKRLSKKLLYFLAIKETTDQLSYYWHRAFLIDHMLRIECLNSEEEARVAVMALDQVLEDVDTRPLSQLARQIVARVSHVFRTLRRARRGQEDEVVAETKSLMAQTWDNFGEYLAALAVRYEQTYFAIVAQQRATRATDQPA
jgi:hypothetical protein